MQKVTSPLLLKSARSLERYAAHPPPSFQPSSLLLPPSTATRSVGVGRLDGRWRTASLPADRVGSREKDLTEGHGESVWTVQSYSGVSVCSSGGG